MMAEPKTDHEIELLNACKEGNIDVVEELLSLNLIKLNDRRSYFDYYLIIEALHNHHYNLANLLIQKGFRVYKKSKPLREKTILHAVVQSGNHELLGTLLIKGASADILSLDEQNKTPFHLAIDKNELSIISDFLAQFPAKAFDEKYVLHYAIKKDDSVVVSQLISHGLSLKKKNEQNCTPFCLALRTENYKILDILLSFYSVEKIKTNNYDDVAPVYIASICGNVEFIKKYTDFGLPIDLPLKSNSQSWSSLDNCSGFTLLHFAVKHVKLKVVVQLLRLGADILVKDGNGSTPLHLAFVKKVIGIWETWKDFDNNNSMIDQILKTNKKLKSNPINNNGLSHFHIACSRDEPKVVEHFIKLGASVNQPIKCVIFSVLYFSQCYIFKKFSPLHFSAKFRCKKTMELLLKSGANVKQRDFLKMTALHIAAKESCLETVSLLLQYGADVAAADSLGNTPVHLAFEKKNYKILDLLVSAPNFANSNPTNREGVSHFHISCTRNNVDVVKSFIKKNRVVIDICVPTKSNVNWSGYSPLHFAVSHNKAKLVQLLLESGANVGKKCGKGSTPLHLACHHTHESFGDFIDNILDDLIKQGKITKKLKPLTDVHTVFEMYFNGLRKLTRKINWLPNRVEHMKVIDLLLNYGSDVNCTDDGGHSPIFYAYSTFREVKYILKNNLNHSKLILQTEVLEDTFEEIYEDFTREIYERRKLILKNLLMLDVNLNKCFENRSILHYVVANHEKDKESDEMLKLFLRRGADVNNHDDVWTPLHIATFIENKSIMKILLNHGADADGANINNNPTTPLLVVTQKSSSTFHDAEVVKMLLDKGANPNARRSNGRTALHNLASRPPDMFDFDLIDPVVSVLIKAGADIDSRDAKGMTPLHVACFYKRENNESVEVILSYGADINVENNKGESVCCWLYDLYAKNRLNGEANNNVVEVMYELQKHIVKMKVVGLPVSEKVLLSSSKFNEAVKVWMPDMMHDDRKAKLIEKCRSEVQLLRDTKIRGSCSLFDVIFKDENVLSHLVRIREFKVIAQSKSFEKKFEKYGYLVRMKYQAGLDRGKLLPVAKCVLNGLAGVHLPDTCTENICRFFTNAELRECVGIVRGVLDLENDNSDNIQLRGRRTHKRRKFY